MPLCHLRTLCLSSFSRETILYKQLWFTCDVKLPTTVWLVLVWGFVGKAMQNIQTRFAPGEMVPTVGGAISSSSQIISIVLAVRIPDLWLNSDHQETSYPWDLFVRRDFSFPFRLLLEFCHMKPKTYLQYLEKETSPCLSMTPKFYFRNQICTSTCLIHASNLYLHL